MGQCWLWQYMASKVTDDGTDLNARTSGVDLIHLEKQWSEDIAVKT